MFKWILAVVGYFVLRGFFGAVAGYFIGTLIDSFYGNTKSQGNQGFHNPFNPTEKSVNLGDFELNLLSLSAIVIKADGEVSQRELDYVRSFFVQQFGKERANATFRTFNEVVKSRSVEVDRISDYLRSRTTYEMRLQILHFLFGVANADGKILNQELYTLTEIASHLRIQRHDFESIKAMFVDIQSADNSYKILEIDKNASDSEVKKAYREMVKKFHPDKLVGMDEAYKKGAREKFNKVQEAYDKIKRERGFS